VVFKPSRAKDDPSEAELALDLLLRHPKQFTALKPQSAAMHSLVSLIEQCRELVNDKTRFTNRLCSTLKQHYPQALDWFEHRDTPLFCDFLTRWSTPLSAKRAHKGTLEAFFCADNGRRAKLIEAHLASIRTASALTEYAGIIEPCRLYVLVLVEQLCTVISMIDRFDKEISQVALALPDYMLFRSLPGAGQHLAPRLLVASDEQHERFHSAAELQTYSGIVPVTERSGKKSWVHWRWQCLTFSAGPLWSGPDRPSTSPFGRGPTIDSRGPKAAPIMSLYGRLHSSGSKFSTAAGRPILSTTRPPI